MPLKYDTALITGASAGLGEEFAHQLAACSRQLVLVSRRRSPMEDLARVLRGAYPGLEVHVLECDLAKPEAVEQLVGALAARGLVRVTRHGTFGRTHDLGLCFTLSRSPMGCDIPLHGLGEHDAVI